MIKKIKKRFNWKRILLFLSVIGPGLITSSVDNDAGGIATYSVAGAHFGYSMLWSLIPITIILVIVQEMSARMGVVTRKGLADLIRENLGIKLTLFIMIGLIIANFATTVSEFAGIASSGEIFGLSKYILVPIVAGVVWLLILKSNYKILEKFFLVLILFYFTYVIAGFWAKPDWGVVAKETFLPTINFTPAYLIVLIAMIGTTITPWMQFYLQSSIVEKGVKIKEYAYSKIEVIIGCLSTDMVSFFIIIACATTLFPLGIKIANAGDAALALKPIAGNLASGVFATGFFGAALFGAFILPLATAFYICEAFGWESGVNKNFKQAKQFYTIIASMIMLSALIILIPNVPLVWIMVSSQVINGVILPFTLIAMLFLINNEKLMGKYVNSKFYNILVWATAVIVVILTILMVITTFFPDLFSMIF
ncbi:Nramp family divalent metal transporter [Candidatus Woesearchaeota archaeon]|nr:Nramp family divalent metal transporter [Candidatus Woesearchaeota archaeon]